MFLTAVELPELNFPDGSHGKESACNVGDLGSIPGSGRSPERGLGNPLQYACLENPHGQRSLAGYSPWGPKELDKTERLSTHKLQLDVKVIFKTILYTYLLNINMQATMP